LSNALEDVRLLEIHCRIWSHRWFRLVTAGIFGFFCSLSHAYRGLRTQLSQCAVRYGNS